MAQNPNVVVVCFVMSGCHHCHAYKPKFDRVAAKFAGAVRSVVLDAMAPQNQALANRFGVNATPATLVLRRPVGHLKLEGDLPLGEIERVFGLAARAR